MVIELPASLAEFGFPRFDSAAETGMISRWLLHANASVSSTHTGSPVSVRWKGSAAVESPQKQLKYHLFTNYLGVKEAA